jgi:hypothetical protein
MNTNLARSTTPTIPPAEVSGVPQSTALALRQEGEDVLRTLACKPDWTIRSAEEHASTVEYIRTAKKRWAELEAEESAATAPMLQAVATVRSWFAGPKTAWTRLEMLLKVEVSKYVKTEADKQQAALAAAVALVQLPAAPVEQVQSALAAISQPTKVAGSSTRKVWKCEIIEPHLVPRQYCTPHIPTLNAAVKGGVHVIPGCRIYEDISVTVRQ